MKVLSFNSKQCERIRRQMDGYLSNELLVETTGEVLKHLEDCQACARELESRTRVRDALRRAAEKRLPPEDLSKAIHQRLVNAQPRTFAAYRPPGWALALAGVALVIVVITAGQQWLKFRHGKELVASILKLGASDHLECAIKGHNYPDAASSPEVLRKKLGPEYAALLPVVEEKLPGFVVLEAHLCHVHGSKRQYVHFIARGRGTILSVVLTRRQGESFPSGRYLVTRAVGGMDLYEAHLDGFNVAGFEWSGYFGFVVSSLDMDRTVQFASSLAPALRRTLNTGLQSGKAKTAAFLFAPDFNSLRPWCESGSQMLEEGL